MKSNINESLAPSRRTKLAKRMATYTAAASAAATLAAESAEAEVVYQNLNETIVTHVENTAMIGEIDLDENGTIDFQFAHQFFNSMGNVVGATGANLTGYPNITSNQFTAVQVNSYFYLQNLAENTLIDGSLASLTSTTNIAYLAEPAVIACPNCEFNADTTGIVGITFDANNDGTTNYGWIRLRVDDGPMMNRLTLVDFAYDDAGDAIRAAAVPEPGCLGLLALGGLGLTAWRRRRKGEDAS